MKDSVAVGDISPENLFSQVLLEQLTGQGIVAAAVSRYSPSEIFLVVAGLTYAKWLDLHELTEEELGFNEFFHYLQGRRAHALRVIAIQAPLMTGNRSVH